MFYLWFFMCLMLSPISSQQYYDQTTCSSNTINPGTRYTCNSSRNRCRTFLIYRANPHFPTLANISNLFGTDPHTLLSINKNASNSSRFLESGHEVLVPILCSCSGDFYQANFTFVASENSTLSEISCGIYEGLVKSVALAEENRNQLPENGVVRAGSRLVVPLKCACPDSDAVSDGVKYLVTYPFVEGDDTRKVSEKLNVSVEEIWRANHLDPHPTPTVFPNTTVLVPLRKEPLLNLNFPESEPPTPLFLPTNPVEKKAKNSHLKNVYIAALVLGFALILVFLISCGLYIKTLTKFKGENVRSLNRISSLNSCSTPRSSPFSRSSLNSCLSPDLLVGIKYSLSNYTVEDLKQASGDFDDRINESLYKGVIESEEVMIKRLRFEGTKRMIDVHSKINHVNIVKLHGVCYGDDEDSYLVFEFPSNGSLRSCLASNSGGFTWLRRTQIACDIARGLHYLHYSVIPPCTNQDLSSRNIFLSSSWRGKITVFGRDELVGPGGWVAPEYGMASEKVDIFAFGVVLLELISGKEGVDGEAVRESIGFLGGGERGNEGGCFDQLRGFVDPCLKGDYPLAEALCLAVLAGSCVEDDPLHRPSMDDVLKILARMV